MKTRYYGVNQDAISIEAFLQSIFPGSIYDSKPNISRISIDSVEFEVQLIQAENTVITPMIIAVVPLDTITIDREKYKSLQKKAAKLSALECTGVDNWEGYDIAMESLSEE